MKKLLLMTIVLLGVAGNADAKFVGPSDSTEGGAVMTVSEISGLKDDKMVVMRGTIEKHLKKDKYQFVDSTGKIVVEIDGKQWRGLDITPNDTVMIVGEVDKSLFHDTQIEVDSINKVK